MDPKWVDVNKGMLQDPVIRCRLVVRDFKPKGEPARGDLFAAMPPLEAKEVLLSIAASHPWVMRNGRLQRPKLMFIDVKKAHMNGVVGPDEYAYVKMPCDPSGHCRRLRRWAVWHAPCGKCLGGRLFQNARGVRLDGRRIFPSGDFQYGR